MRRDNKIQHVQDHHPEYLESTTTRQFLGRIPRNPFSVADRSTWSKVRGEEIVERATSDAHYNAKPPPPHDCEEHGNCYGTDTVMDFYKCAVCGYTWERNAF